MGFSKLDWLKQSWHDPLLRAAMVAAVVLIIAGIVAGQSRKFEKRALDSKISREADVITIELEHLLNQTINAARYVELFFANSIEVTAEEFRGYLADLMERESSIESIRLLRKGGEAVYSVEKVPPRDEMTPEVPPFLFEASSQHVVYATDLRQTPGGGLFLYLYKPVVNAGRARVIELRVNIRKIFEQRLMDEVQDNWRVTLATRGGEHLFGATKHYYPPEKRLIPFANQLWVLIISPETTLLRMLSWRSGERIILIGTLLALAFAIYHYLLAQRQRALESSLARSEALGSELETTRQKLSELINGVEAVVWESSSNEPLEFSFVSDFAEELLGYDAEDWIGNGEFLMQRIHHEDRASVKRTWSKALETGESQNIEFRFIDRYGDPVYVNDTITVSRRNGRQKLQLRGVMVDITKRVRAEEALQQSQKLESLGVLAGGIAHDFNNLLTAILGNVELARDSLSGNPECERCIDNIETTARRLAELTRQILDYSGMGTFQVSRVNINRVIREIGEIISVTLPKRVTLVYELDDGIPDIEGDPGQIQQVILNLLTNGAEAIGDNTGSITLRTGADTVQQEDWADSRDTLSGGEYVTLEVIDTGCGMDTETQQKIFDPFFTTKFTGRGLGLAALLGIIRAHHGGIKIRSALGQGTAFKIYLPAMPADAAPEAGPAPAAPEDFVASGTALVIDDEDSIRSLVGLALESRGFTVYTADDGASGVQLFAEHLDDTKIIVLDLTMAGMSGDEAFYEMKKLRANIPVILISGYSPEDVISRFSDAKPDAFMKKPFLPSEVAAKAIALLHERAESA